MAQILTTQRGRGRTLDANELLVRPCVAGIAGASEFVEGDGNLVLLLAPTAFLSSATAFRDLVNFISREVPVILFASEPQLGMTKLRCGHELAKIRSIRLFGWLCGSGQYRGHEGDAGSDDALHFTVLPRDRRISIFSIKAKSALTVTKERAFINALFLGLDEP
jgi:hypothetical protein